MKKAISILLVLAMVLGLMPWHVVALPIEEKDFAGKTVSILSHSASTYAGVSNDTAANSTIGKNDIYYTVGRHNVYLKDTWWQQIIDALGMRLLVNNSWSGSCVFMPRKGEASVGYGDRAVNLHNDHTGEEPDVIFVYLGCNDFAYYKDTFGTAADVDYASLIQEKDGAFSYGVPQTTCEAYAIMLHKVQTRYPDAQIYCMTSTARRETDYTGDSYPDAGQPTEYSAQLQQVAKHFGYPVIDLENAIPKEIEVFDKYMGDKRAHPNALGMDRITNEVLSVMLGRDAEIRHVICEDGTVQEQAVLLGGSYCAAVESREGYAVTVTMNAENITAEVYNDGKITIEKITGDIVIHSNVQREPVDFAWAVQDDVLVSVGAADNTANKLAGTIANGTLNNTRYQLETSVVLKHDLPWVVEWQCAGDWRGCVFTTDPVQSTKGMCYLSRTVGGQLCFGTWTGQQYDNYGVDLSDLDDQSHTYRLVNKISADGSNMVWVYVDGTEIGQMNHYYIGSKDQAKTSDWISGKDFIFPYISMDGHALKNCCLDYLKVQECGHTYKNGVCAGCGAAEPVQALPLRYDDHYDITGKTVEIIAAGTPTSYQVGYGVAENAVLDTAVVALEGDCLVATGIGAAKVRIDGQLYEITVTAAPISFLLLIGQSNMEGNEGDLNQSIVCPDGMVYATYGDRYDMVLENATHYAPSALTGDYRTVNTVGGTDGLSDYPVYMLTDEGDGRKGPDSGFAYEWIKQTGEKVWIVNASHGGTSLNVWQPGTTQYEECQAMFGACAETLRKEIAAGHFTLSHMAYFWCQGCNDYDKTAQWYVENYLNMHNALKTELAFDHDSDPATENKTFEFGGIIPVRAGHEWRTYYREGVYTDTTDKSYYESFLDLQMSGPRVAQYWMGNNPELTDIWNVCTIGESWVWMPDGTNGVSEYFQAHYPGGRVDYTTQKPQKEAWYTPTTPAAVHDSIHYNQIGYNEVGREAVRNALIYMGIKADYEEPTTVKFVDWTGYRQASQIGADTKAGSATLVVPIVTPVTRCKDVTYALTEGLDYSWYDLTAATADAVGTLEAVGTVGSVFVEKQKPGALYAPYLSQLPESICAGVNLWTALEHDSQYYTVSGWGVHGSGQVYSVTVPVQAGDRIWATSMCANGVNGNTVGTGHGIRVTFFGDYGVIVSMTSTDVYAEFSANGYLTAPEGTTAVNVPMWSNSDQNELYILNLPHSGDPVCGICGKDTHEHGWSDWQTVLVPSQDGPGREQRVCAGCGSTESREVAGVWQTLELGKYLLELPENVCCNLDLWKVLEHNEYYFHSGVKWAKHESGKIRSVTIPVSEGDRIYATSFGKYPGNGNTVSKADGIRVTFFDAYGVVKTTDPAGTYEEFSKNGGYLIAPEGTVAINIAMWNESDDNEIYILSHGHCYENRICAGCGQALEKAFDLSGDGKVTAFDAQILAEAQAGARELTVGQQAALVGILPQDILDYILGRFHGPTTKA